MYQKLLTLVGLASLPLLVTSQELCKRFICAKESEFSRFYHSDHQNCGVDTKDSKGRDIVILKPCGKSFDIFNISLDD